jgi:membrane protease YdiL (CAAX protease family)
MSVKLANASETPGAFWAHILPFLVWVLVMSVPMEDVVFRYLLQTVLGAGALAFARPWRFHGAGGIRHWPLAVGVGALVCVVWILPESHSMARFSRVQDFYLKYGIRPFGVITGHEWGSPYAPEVCGWGLSLVRLAGSAFVIAVAEEYFWRGFLMRWMEGRNFGDVAPAAVGGGIFLVVAVLFGFEHDRWAVGIVAGLAYGWIYVRTGALSAAVVAHLVTNFLLGLYVLAFAAYEFW